MSGITSVAITREASGVLDVTARCTGLSKSYLADVAIKFFFDRNLNPHLDDAIAILTSGRKQAEYDFMRAIFQQRLTPPSQVASSKTQLEEQKYGSSG